MRSWGSCNTLSCLLDHSSSSVSRAAVPPTFAVVTALAGAWWSVRHSRLSRAYTDRPVCVSGGAIFALPCPCCPAASTFGAMVAARESPSRGLLAGSRLSCFLRAALVIVVASPRFPQLFTWHFRVLARAAHLPTRSTQSFAFLTLYSRHRLSTTSCLLACDIRCC